MKARCVACDQDVSVERIGNATFPGLRKDNLVQASPKLTFRFLCSPKEIVVGPDGRIRQLVVTENDLVLRGDGNTGATKPNLESPSEPVYEMWNPRTAKALDGTYVAG